MKLCIHIFWCQIKFTPLDFRSGSLTTRWQFQAMQKLAPMRIAKRAAQIDVIEFQVALFENR